MLERMCLFADWSRKIIRIIFNTLLLDGEADRVTPSAVKRAQMVVLIQIRVTQLQHYSCFQPQSTERHDKCFILAAVNCQRDTAYNQAASTVYVGA